MIRSLLLAATFAFAAILSAVALPSAAVAMGTRPGTIPAGSDSIARADFDTATLAHSCAMPLFTARQNAIKATFDGYYTLVSEAYTKHNAPAFHQNAAIMGKVVTDLRLPCPVPS